MQFGILGPLEVRSGRRTIALGSSQQRTVLATLLLSANRPVSVDRLKEALWGDQPPGSASAVLKNRVSQLRKLLAPAELSTDPSGYLLRVGPDELDLDRFERLAREGRDALAEGDPGQAAATLAEALALWRGPALADFAFAEFAQAEIGRLEELRLATLEDRLEADLAYGRAAELVPELESLCEEHPLRERLRKQLMLALYRSGRQAEALESYQAARQVLVKGLGIDPSPDLKALHQQILNQDESLAAPARPVQDVPMTNLAVQPTSLIGRAHQLRELGSLLSRDEVRLITLTGPGGTGKTRLAAQLAAEVIEQFPQGVYFVSLASIRDADLVVPTIAQTLGLQEMGEETLEKTLCTYLRDKTMLLVLDNFEQIVEAAQTIAWMLANSRGLNILVTSRMPLHLSSEHDYGVPPLLLPDPDQLPDVAGLLQYEAVALFVERARAVKASFTVTSDNAAVVGEICLRLDGLPLALELAAARIRSLPPQTLLARLDERLKLLTGGARDLDERQRTLRATIDWSYELLSLEEKALFVSLGVFVGGCRLDASEAVCGPRAEFGVDLLDGLNALVEKSLLWEQEDPDGEPRYWMLETIREYALERINEPGVRGAERELPDRHASYFRELVERAHAESRGAEQAMWLQRLQSDHDNLRAALDWAGEIGDSETELALTGGLWRFWRTRGHLSEGRRRLREALDRAGDAFPELRAAALKGAAILADRQGAYVEAMRLAEKSVELYRAIGDDRDLAYALATLGTVAASSERFEQSEEFFGEALRLARDVGDAEVLGITLANLGDLALSRGDYRMAQALSAESLDLDRERGDIEGQAISLFNVGLASIELGAPEEGEATLAESLTLFHQLGNSEGIAYCLEGLAAAACSRGHGLHSARLLAAAESLLEALGISLRPAELDLRERTLARLHVICDLEAFDAATGEGRSLTVEQAVDLAGRRDLSRD